jgi:putative transposase
MWLEKKPIDFKATYREFYEKYKPPIGAVTIQQILNKNDGVWKSFFGLLKLKKEGRLPQFINKVNPPGFGKRNGSRTLWTVIRKINSSRPWHNRLDRTKMQGPNIFKG